MGFDGAELKRKKQQLSSLSNNQSSLETSNDKVNIKEEALSEKTIMFPYSNAFGENSNRVVDVQRIYRQSGKIYLEAYCRDRQAQRTFRLDRITGDIYIPALALVVSPESYAAGQDIEEDGSGEINAGGKQAHATPVIAPSGFNFPFFQYTDDTIVKIYDSTNYYEWMLQDLDSKHTNNFSQADFDYFFEHDFLEIEVDSFETMFRPAILRRLGFPSLSGLFDFYKDVLWKIENDEPLVWYLNQPIYKKLVKNNLLAAYDPERSAANVSEYLEQFKVPELKALCKKFNEKTTQTKPNLIGSLLKHKDKIQIDKSVKPNREFSELIGALIKAYLSDIKRQLTDKPSGYGIPVWEYVSDDYLLTEKARKYAKDQVEVLISNKESRRELPTATLIPETDDNINNNEINMQHCADCQRIISVSATICPCCGSKAPKGAATAFGCLGSLAFFTVLVFLGNNQNVWASLCFLTGVWLLRLWWQEGLKLKVK